MRHIALFLGLLACAQQGGPAHAGMPGGNSIGSRFSPPDGFARVAAAPGSFGAYLRSLPLEPPGAPVHLFNGSLKHRQDVHAAVVRMSVGKKDLQQCADAVMRLRAEHWYGLGRYEDIHFRFTDGTLANFGSWAAGQRFHVGGPHGTRMYMVRKTGHTHEDLMEFLEQVFMYAGTLSLSKELVPSPSRPPAIGDVFIRGGSPGHAAIVVDIAGHADGRIAFLLAQSYMPAQEIHVLKNLRHPEREAWFILGEDDALYTPEWTFAWSERRSWPQ